MLQEFDNPSKFADNTESRLGSQIRLKDGDTSLAQNTREQMGEKEQSGEVSVSGITNPGMLDQPRVQRDNTYSQISDDSVFKVPLIKKTQSNYNGESYNRSTPFPKNHGNQGVGKYLGVAEEGQRSNEGFNEN